MQIHSASHPDYNVARGQADPSYNIDYGTSLLAQLHQTYHSWWLATEHYNGSGWHARRYANTVMHAARTHPWGSI
ncbi:MAG: transglycosylase SLT domain-containing protein [Candidatus Xenobia bacterium]